MIEKGSKILQSGINEAGSLLKRTTLVCIAMLLFFSDYLSAQVISNTGASISVSSIVVVNSKDVENTGGLLGNNGTINLTGSFTNFGSVNGNGFYNIRGDWTNTGFFNPGTSTVTLNGTTNQIITHGTTGETFYNLVLNNPGSVITQIANAGNTLGVLKDLTITAGSLSLHSTTASLLVGGKATINGSLIFNGSTTQTTTIGDILSGPGTIDMSGGNLPHVMNLAGSANSIGTFATSPASSSTVNYNGITQTVFPATNYRNLIISNSGVKTLQGNSIVNLRLFISGGTFDLGTSATTFNVLGSTKINGSLAFNGTSAKIVNLNDSLTGTGSLDMSGGNLPHFLYLNGTINTVGTYSSGAASTVDYVRNGDQGIFTSNDYRNLRITGSGLKTIFGDVTSNGILTMSSGSINSNGSTLILSNTALGALVRTNGTIIGKFQRAIGQLNGEYLYPLGSFSNYNPLKIKFKNLTGGPVTGQYKAEDIGNLGLPLDDNGDEIWDRFTEGYWSLTSFAPLASSNFDVNLNFTGFSGIDRSSRIIKRTDGGSLAIDGKHDSLSVFPEILRDSLSKGISLITTDLALGKGRPKIVTQPLNYDVCEWANAFFQVTARGGSGSLTYRWQVSANNGIFFTTLSDGGVYSGTGTRRLTLTAVPSTMTGLIYRCIITDGAGNTNITDMVHLRVNLIPIARSTPAFQDECPGVAFQTINLTTTNSVTGTTFAWIRDNPAGITAFGLPLSGTAIGDLISGTFSNSTDGPLTVTFTITPTGPVTEYAIDPPCTGSSIVATVTVNPTPRLFPVPANTVQCDSTTTGILLQSPSAFSSGVVTFNHSYTMTGAVTGFTTPATGLLNNSYITDKLVNQTNVFQVVTYSVIPISPAGCADGPTKSFTVTVNPTPSVKPINLNSLKPDSSICFGGTTSILLTSLTQMSPGYGNMRFDFRVNVSGAPGVVTGVMTRDSNRIPGYQIRRTYQNSSDTLQSVFFTITPKVDNAICNKGPAVVSQIRVHPEPARYIQIIKPLTCEGGSDATMKAITSKGVNPMGVYWQGPFGYTESTLLTITNRPGGRYRVTLTDNLGCSNYKETDIQGAQISPYLLVYPKITGNGITCPGYNDGVLWIQASGGTPVYNFWVTRNSLDTTSALFHDTLSAAFTGYKIFNNLYHGDYTLTVRDANGCVGSLTQNMSQPDTINVIFGKKIYSGGFNISCKSYTDGKVWVKSISGGNEGYIYQWKNSAGVVISTTDTITGVPAGKYYLLTTDSQACTKLDSVIVTEPNGMGLAGVILKTSRDGNYNISCNGYNDGKITLNITGGSGSYQYQWTTPDGIVTTSVNEISGLKAGHYTAVVKDFNNCTLSPLDTILTQPPLLTLADTLSRAPDGVNNINCFGGTGKIGLNVSGGSAGNYRYTWSTSNGTGLIAGQKDQPSLTTGSYHIVVTDSNLCSINKDIQLTQPSKLITQLIPKHITCTTAGFNNGSVDLTASGGVSPYLYNWSNGATSEDISGLTQGWYKVNVHDINGCPKADSVKINLPPDLTFNSTLSSFNGFNVSCLGLSDGSINIVPVTGQAPYQFAWSNGSTSKDIAGLKAGSYNLLITDANQCKATGTFNLTEPAKISMILTPSVSTYGNFNINCAGSGTGTINVTPVNNVGSVRYLWSDGDTSRIRSKLLAGTYGIVITDKNNCQAPSSIVLTQPDSIKTSFTVRRAFCPDSPDGEILLNVKGGVAISDYSFRWSDNSITQNLYNILRGKYRVLVTDANNCTASDSVNMVPLNETCLSVPNAFSPNGDNINDIWNIDKIDLYPQAEIKVFNSWGELLWRSERGYPHPWDGRSNGIILPIDSYTYIIDLHNGTKPIVGAITIMR